VSPGLKGQQINSRLKVGQWYTRLDTKEAFLVTGYDDTSRMIETQAINGDLDKIDAADWIMLPLAHADPPEDWTEALNDVEALRADASITPIEKFFSNLAAAPNRPS
jgi:hypothetical protein